MHVQSTASYNTVQKDWILTLLLLSAPGPSCSSCVALPWHCLQLKQEQLRKMLLQDGVPLRDDVQKVRHVAAGPVCWCRPCTCTGMHRRAPPLVATLP
jgi:hypothetical protein